MISLPETNNKIAILFTGGMESYLLGKLCIQKYGAERVVFVMWNMDEYNIFYKKSINVIIKRSLCLLFDRNVLFSRERCALEEIKGRVRKVVW